MRRWFVLWPHSLRETQGHRETRTYGDPAWLSRPARLRRSSSTFSDFSTRSYSWSFGTPPRATHSNETRQTGGAYDQRRLTWASIASSSMWSCTTATRVPPASSFLHQQAQRCGQRWPLRPILHSSYNASVRGHPVCALWASAASNIAQGGWRGADMCAQSQTTVQNTSSSADPLAMLLPDGRTARRGALRGVAILRQALGGSL